MTDERTPDTGFFRKLIRRITLTQGHSGVSTLGNRVPSLRWYLVLLVSGTLLPVVLFAVGIVYRLSLQDQAASERRALLAARNLASSVEHELTSSTRTLQALAASQQLHQGNLRNFHNEAKRVAQTQTTWVSVILLSPKGQQLVNTRQPFGKQLPSVIEPASLQKVVRTKQPTIGNLARGQLEPTLAIPVRIPILRDHNLQYILTAIINQKTFAQVVAQQTTIDGEWTRTIVDNQGVVVARTRNPERFVGKPGTPSFLRRIAETTEGIYRDTTLEGRKVYVAFCRVPNSGWTAAVTIPVDVIQAPGQRAIWLVTGAGLVLLFLSGIGAFILSQPISRGINSAAIAAEALAKGEFPRVDFLSIRELVLLGQSLEFAAQLLTQREQERTDNLRRAETARTEAEAARAEAEAANRIKDEFLAVLSHELRTPLNPILGWSKLLRSQGLDATKTAYALETIERNAKLQTQLIEDLLDVARIMRGKLGLNIAPVNLGSIIEATVETVRLAAEAKSIQIQMMLPPTAKPILGDIARLQQVIWNLLSNAIKFTAEGGQVYIQLLFTDSEAQIQVSDTGKGIDPNFLPHVFEYFRQEDGKTTRKFGGLGLGLAIVKHLVELHGGTVQAESSGEGLGATFRVKLPLNQEENQTMGDGEPFSGSSIPGSPTLTHLQVLLVDDDPDTRVFIAFTLEQKQAIVTAVASAKEALQAFDRTHFDLLISDIGMPEMDGYALMRQIRMLATKQHSQISAIALTAYVGETNQQKALEAGFQLHLAKPVDPEKLVQAIVQLMEQKQK